MNRDQIRKRIWKRKLKSAMMLSIFIGFIIGYTMTNIIISQEEGIHISIVYSSEKASWMTIAYNDFLEYWNSNYNEKLIVEMHPYGSSDSVISILNGEIFPTIWSPACNIWIPFLNAKWKELTKSNVPIINENDTIRIIYSPIVIATWEDFNKTYGLKGIKDLHSLCVNSSINIKLAHTDPRLSNSGYMSVVMAISVAAGKPSQNLTMNDLENETIQNWVTELESRAVLYGKSTGFLARYMKNSGPSSLTVAFLYENLVKDISSTSVGGKVIAIYPKEGTVFSDHPFCILNGEWITPKQRWAAHIFLDFLNKTETKISAMQYGFRLFDESIPLDPNVFNYEKNGISLNFSSPELKPPLDTEALLRIPDFWLLCKATSN
ncbi:MAG: substrate-binding domain-containing protein [Promethearchaeota archaeon]